MGIKSMQTDPETHLKNQRVLIQRMLDDTYLPPYQSLFLDLDENAMNEMEVLFGPRMTESEELLVQTFLQQYGLTGRKSSLRIQ